MPPPPPLTSVLLVLQHATVGAQVSALPHVAIAISDCLDHSLSQRWMLPRACEANYLHLLTRLVTRDISLDVDPHYWRYRCCLGLMSAVKNENLKMVELLHKFCPSVILYHAMIQAAKKGNVLLLEWLAARHPSDPWLPHMVDASASTGGIKML